MGYTVSDDMSCGEQGKIIINSNAAATPPILIFELRDICDNVKVGEPVRETEITHS